MTTTIDGTSGVTYPAGSTATVAGVGDGQTWQLPTRVSGTTYTNSTGKPILVCISLTYSATSPQSSTITVDSVIIQSSGGNNVSGASSQPVHTFVVAAGGTYVASIGGTLSKWSELR